jgi:hypothetical protein
LLSYISKSRQPEESTDKGSNNKESNKEGKESKRVLLLLLLLLRYIPRRSVQEEVSINNKSTDKESINKESTEVCINNKSTNKESINKESINTESNDKESNTRGDIIKYLAQQLQEFKGCSKAKHKKQA